MRRLWTAGGLPLLILLGGVGIFGLFMWTGAPPPREERVYPGPLVEAVDAPAQAIRMVVEGQGTVRPGAQVELAPQVAGSVVWKSPNLKAGGFFEAGELLFRIDAEDYELALAQAEALEARAAYRLDVMRQEAALARREWQTLQGEAGDAPSPLVFQEPQLRAAKAEFEAAQAQVAEARLRVKRTRVVAPFRGRVRSAAVDVGQLVSPGRPVAQLYGIDYAEISVPVPDEDLAWLDLAGLQSEGEPIAAAVRGWFAGEQHIWQGRLVRTGAEMDAQSRMVSLIVEVPDPYRKSQGPPLVPGMFVTVSITGKVVPELRVLPRAALREGDVIYAVREGVLSVRTAQLVRSRKDEVLVFADVAPGERVVVSQLSGVTEGMKVRIAERGDR